MNKVEIEIFVTCKYLFMLANGFHHKNIGSLKEFLRFDINYCTPIEKWNQHEMNLAWEQQLVTLQKKRNFRTMDSDSKKVKYLPK